MLSPLVHCFNTEYPTGLSDFFRGSLYLIDTFPDRLVHICLAHHPELSAHLHPGPPCPGAEAGAETKEAAPALIVHPTDDEAAADRVRLALLGRVRAADGAASGAILYLHTNVEAADGAGYQPRSVERVRGLLRWRSSVLRYVDPFVADDARPFVVVHVRLPDRYFGGTYVPPARVDQILDVVRRGVGDLVLSAPSRAYIVLCNHSGVARIVQATLRAGGLVCPDAPSLKTSGPVHTNADAAAGADADAYAATLADWALVGRADRVLQFSALDPVGRSGFSDVPALLHSVPVVAHDIRPLFA